MLLRDAALTASFTSWRIVFEICGSRALHDAERMAVNEPCPLSDVDPVAPVLDPVIVVVRSQEVPSWPFC